MKGLLKVLGVGAGLLGLAAYAGKKIIEREEELCEEELEVFVVEVFTEDCPGCEHCLTEEELAKLNEKIDQGEFEDQEAVEHQEDTEEEHIELKAHVNVDPAPEEIVDGAEVHIDEVLKDTEDHVEEEILEDFKEEDHIDPIVVEMKAKVDEVKVERPKHEQRPRIHNNHNHQKTREDRKDLIKDMKDQNK